MWNNDREADQLPNSQSPVRYKSSGGFFYSPGKQGTPSPVHHNTREFLQNVVPCTVAEILKVPETEENIKIGSFTAYIVTVVGRLQFVEHLSNRLIYKLDDMTSSPIIVNLWLGFKEDIPKELITISSDCPYFRVVGRYRCVQGERFLHALKLIPITDLNEISMHSLEIIQSRMSISMMELQLNVTLEAVENLRDACSNLPINSKASEVPTVGISQLSQQACASGSAIPESLMGLTKIQIMILRCITTANDPAGIGYDYLFTNLKTLDKHVILKAVEFLCNEGHIYNTIDDDHFRATDEDLFS